MNPNTFTVETILGCQLSCRECAIGGGLVKRTHGVLSFLAFKKIARKIEPYCQYLYLHLWGEPLLNTDILQMIRYASTFTRTNISTNANNLDPELAEALIDSGVTDIIVSIDGMTQEVYEQYRQGGSLEKACHGLVLLQKFNARHDRKVNIAPQFLVFGHNQHQMTSFSEFCHANDLKPAFKAPYIRKDSVLSHSDHGQYVREKSTNPDLRRKNMTQCPNALDVFTIHRDGAVVCCCYDHNQTESFGNIFEQPVADIWEGTRFRQFRTGILKGNPPPFCMEHCLLY